MQAVILVGGEGTRLRPLTTWMPKPVVTLVDRPFMAFMLQWLARHGVEDVIMACGFRADKVADVLGDGSRYGVRLKYLEEPEPRGTAGALKFAEDHLQDCFLMLNGDVLSDIDISAQITQHEATGARGTLALMAVDDPSAYGLVLCDEDRAVTGFLEKPGPEQLDGIEHYLISAGVYVLERSVLDLIEPDRMVSIEHEIWPQLVGEGLYGYDAGKAYWLDIGTPDRYLDATADILSGTLATAVGERLDDARQAIAGTVEDSADVDGPLIVEPGAVIHGGAAVHGPAIIGPGVVVESGAVVERSVILDGCIVRTGAHVRDSILAPRVSVGERSVVGGNAVLGEAVSVAADTILEPGVKLFGGTQLAAGAISERTSDE